MKFNLFITSILVIMLSMVVSKIVYFGFTPNYGADIFSRKAFGAKFDHGEYQYRLLSKYLVYGVDKFLGRSMKEGGAEARLRTVTGEASERFYYAIYYVNTFFLALTSLMAVMLLSLEKLLFSDTERALLAFFVPVLIGFTQFTVHYYDLSSYFLELLILYVALKGIDTRFRQSMIKIIGLIVVSALNRESAEVSMALIVMMLVSKFGVTKKVVWSISGIFVCWLGTSFVLRLLIGPQTQAPSAPLIIMDGFEPDMFMMGLIFWVLFMYLPFALAATRENKYLIGGFFVLSLPYIINSVMGGDLWAVRLYVPLFLGALFLSRLDLAGAAVRFSESISRRRPGGNPVGKAEG